VVRARGDEHRGGDQGRSAGSKEAGAEGESAEKLGAPSGKCELTTWPQAEALEVLARPGEAMATEDPEQLLTAVCGHEQADYGVDEKEPITTSGVPPRVSPRLPVEQVAAWSAFVQAHAAVIGRVEQQLREERLPPLAWYDVLWPLSRSPEKRLRMSELAREVVLSRTGLVRLVDRVERAGLLSREPVPEDGRGAYAMITSEGEQLLRRLWPVYGAAIRDLFVAPVGGDLRVMRRALEHVAAGAG
jgi:DNA-binding MarR family transcriptional regulator